MNLKNLFKAMFALVLVVFVFTSCENPTKVTGPSEQEKQEVYLYGNCTNAGMHGYVMGMTDNRYHTYSAASLLSMPALVEKGEYLLGVRAYIGSDVKDASVWVGEEYENPTTVKEFTYKTYEKELRINGIYLTIYNEYPNFEIESPNEFIAALIELFNKNNQMFILKNNTI